MIYILYSADYELYLGRNLLPEEEVLIQPTGHLLAACSRLGVPLTLFADVASLWRYREMGRNAFPDLAETQLQYAIRQGHDVQTHLHPHWAFTRFEDNAFLFDPATYLLGTVHPDPTERFRLTRHWLQQATDYLTTLLRPHAPNYQCLAFRAGGYGLQPDERMILKALQETGYRIDSSIIPGARLHTTLARIDFSTLPTRPNYWLSEENGLSAPAPPGTGLFEIPIASCHLNLQDRLTLQLPEALRAAWTILGQHQTPPRGHPCNAPSPPQQPVRRDKRAYWQARATLNVTFRRLELGTNPRALLTCVRRYLAACQTADATQPVFLSLNCHPKGIHPAHIETLTRFHAGLLAGWPDKIQAITFQQAWRLLEHSKGS